ncbi:MAG: sodium ion-translocating decarboxylase subunit beta, partial [Clostridia bacterium]|nr:sodium ion-translocating decarboxylase subunit beta [Clostridia bacterium]
MDILGTLKGLAEDSGFGLFFTEDGWKYLVMLLISFVLLYLGIKKKFEPLLLVGIAIGCLLTNLPGAGLYTPELWDVYAGTKGAQFVTASGDVLTHVTFTDIIHYGGLLDILYIGVKSGLYPCL